MRIVNYETGRTLDDVGIFLTAEEVQELSDYLRLLACRPGLGHVHLSEIRGAHLERELTVSVQLR